MYKQTKDSEVSFKLLVSRGVLRERLSGFLYAKKPLQKVIIAGFGVATLLLIVVPILGNQFAPKVAYAASSGPNTAGTSAGTNWTTPSNTTSSDNSYATYNNTAQDNLVLTNFGFSIPAGSTIDGIEVTREGNGNSNPANGRQFQMSVTKDGSTATGTAKTALPLPKNTDDTVAVGSNTDLWGTTWSVSEIDSSNFGVLIADNDTSAAIIDFDLVTITIYYSPPTANATSYTNSSESGLDNLGGRIGQTIVVSGSNFGTVDADNRSTASDNVTIDTFQVPNGDVTAWSDTSITFIVSTSTDVLGGAGSSGLTVTAGSATDTTPLDFYVYPDITSLGTPSTTDAARETESVTINGNTFDTVTGTVTVFGASATISSWSSSSIAITVPTGVDDSVHTGDIQITRNADSRTATTSFRVLPTITSLTPTSGPDGTSVTITGDHFCQDGGTCPGTGDRNTSTSTVTFAGTNVVTGDVTTWTATSIVALVPSSAASGSVVVKSDTYDSNSDQTFEVIIRPDATSFVNNTDGTLTDGGRPGDQITVTGTDFESGPCTASTTEVRIGTYPVACGNVSSWATTTIIFTIPTGSGLPNGGTATSGLIITKDAAEDSTPLTFYVYPRITAASSTGRQGDTLTLTGDGFGSSQGTSTVTINGTDGTITSFSDTSIDFTIDGGTISGTLFFTRGDDAKTSATSSFTILPRIAASTATSSTAGATTTITGDHFDTATGTVSINGASATVNSWSDTSIEVVVPAGGTASGNMIVTRTDAEVSNSYAFIIDPTITSLSISEGRVGDSIVITGTHFDSDPGSSNRSTASENVSINGAQVDTGDVTAWFDTSITALVPLGGTINGNIIITANSLTSNATSFIILPTIAATTATSGIAGAAITVTGDHFDTATGTISINGATSTITAWADGSISTTIPSGGATSGSIIVTRNADSKTSDSYSFTILPNIDSLSPSSGVVGDSVTISGDHFGLDPGVENRSTASHNITFNGTQAPSSDVTAWLDTSITVNVPIGATTGNVVVTRDGNVSNGDSFTVNQPNATAFTNDTEAGLTDGGRPTDQITVTGSNFGTAGCDGSDYVIKIDSSFSVPCSNVSSWNATSVVFTVPTSTSVYGGTGSNGITLRAGGTDDSTPIDFYVYPIITSITVPSGFASNTAREYDSGDSDGVITLIGYRFGTAGSVTVFGETATTTSHNATSVDVQIPTSITDTVNTGDIGITRTTPSDNKNATSTGFRVLPRVTSLTPNSGNVSDSVTIAGNHFCQDSSCPGVGNRNTSTSTITFNSTNVPTGDVTSWTATSIDVSVPTGATTGPVVVKSDSHDSNGTTFSVGSAIPDATSFVNDTDGTLTDGGRPGEDITVTGTDFDSACSNSTHEVKIGTYSVDCSYVSSWADTSITFTIPTSTSVYGGTGSSGLIVRANDNDDITELNFYVYPDVTSITTPSVADAAKEGDSITLTGRRFGTAGTVTVLGQSASTVWGDTSVTVTIPTTISDSSYTGSVILTRTSPSGNKADTATSSFRILPRITSLSPSSGQAGAAVTISGNHFCQSGSCPSSGNRDTSSDKITFSGVTITDSDVTTWTDTSVAAVAPSGVTTGAVVVRSDDYDSNGLTFTVSTTAPTQGGPPKVIYVEEPAPEPEPEPKPEPEPEPETALTPEEEAEILRIQQEINALLIQLSELQASLDEEGDGVPTPVPTLPPVEEPVPDEEPEIILPPVDGLPVELPDEQEPEEPEEPEEVRGPIFAPIVELIQDATERVIETGKDTVDVANEAVDTATEQARELGEGGRNVVEAVGEATGNIAGRISRAIGGAATEVGAFFRNVGVALSNSVREFALGTKDFVVGVFERPLAPETIPDETFVFRSGELELVADKDAAVQAIVGYKFTAEIEPEKAAHAITDTFKYSDDDNDGVWTADIELPEVPGEFTLSAEIAYADGDTKDLRVVLLIDPEGYIFEQTSRGELRVPNGAVTLHQRVGGEWIVWPAGRYGQENPQLTNNTGQYSFLAPAGEYYIEVITDRYKSFSGNPFVLSETLPVHKNIELEYLGESL